MYTEDMQDDDDKRVWLNSNEIENIIEYYDDEPRKQLLIRLLSHGLRVGEASSVRAKDLQHDDVNQYYSIIVQDGKTGKRRVPASDELARQFNSVVNLMCLSDYDDVIDVSKRQCQRYVEQAVQALEKEESKYWKYVTAHDLRRSWATHTYWSLDASRARECVMSWGGWKDVQTFKSNYLGRIPPSIEKDLAVRAGIL